MQQTSSNYRTEIKQPSRIFECRVTIGKNVYTNTNIVDIILDYPQSQDGFSIGNTTSQSLDLTLFNTGEEIYSTNQIKVEIGLKIGDAIEYILMGYYNVDEVSKNDYTIKFTAFDNMLKFETPYFSSLGDKPTLQQVINELASITGVSFNGSVPNYTVTKLDGYTCREVLSYVASLCGGNAIITRDGKFTIKKLQNVDYSITTDNHFGITTEEVAYKVGKITCVIDSESELSKGGLGTDSMELGFENPWMTESILNTLYQQLNGFSYLGFQTKWQGDLSLDPYDSILIQDRKGTSYRVPILSQKFTYVGGLTSELGAKGESKNKNSFSSSGSNSNKVNRLVTEQAIIKEALINKANIQDLEAVSIRTQRLEATTAKIETAIIDVAYVSDLNVIRANISELKAMDATISQAVINKADISELNAAVANINILNADLATIKHLVAGNISSENIQTGGITSDKLTIANGFIKDAMIDSLNANKIKAGQINTALVQIASSSGNFVINDNTIQIRDANRVRVQIGKDASNDYSMSVWDSSGKLMFDARGLKADAIKDSIIRNDMISTNANIDGSKLNINSVVSSINQGSSLLKASKVQIDGVAQTLEVAFNVLKTQADGTKSQTESNTTAINVAQGKINTLIQDTTITKDGVTTTLKDEYSRLEQTVSGINTVVGKQQTVIDDHTGKITSTNSELSSLSQSVNGLTASVSSAQTTIQSHTQQLSQKADLTTVNEKIDAIQVGVRNLLTKDFMESGNLSGGDGSIIIGGTYTNFYRTKNFIEIENNSAYTLKINRCESGDKIEKIIAYTSDNRYISTYEIHKIEKIFTPPANCEKIKFVVIVSGATTSYIVEEFKIKLEKGTKATDWTPAPEDTQALVDTKANKTDVYTKSEVYTKTQTDSAINIAKDSINLGVSQTYETKANVESKINNAVDSVTVGGRNLIKKETGITYGFLYETSGVVNNTGSLNSNQDFYTNDYFSLKQGESICLSSSVKDGITGSIAVGVFIHVFNTSKVWQKVVKNDTGKVNVNAHVIYTATEDCFVRVNSRGLNVYNHKLERGNKVTDWSPAPEDIDSAIDTTKNELNTAIDTKANSTDVYTKTETYTKSETDSRIKVAKDEINLSVSGTYETKTNVETKVSTSKTEAISTASTDATNKVNSAKTELNTAINKKANSTDVYTKSETYTKTETDSKIKVAKDEINLGVSQTYETKTNVENKISTAVNNVQVGGRNLLVETYIDKYGAGKWVSNGGTISVDSSRLYVDKKTIKVIGNTGIYYNDFIKLARNTTYTYSMMVYSDTTLTVGGTNPLHMWLNTEESANHLEIIKSHSGNVPANTWTKIWVVFSTLNTSDVYYMRPFLYGIGNATVNMCQPMLEKGNKATDWSPAAEDVQSSIDEKANSSDVYTKSETYTKSQTDSAINVAKNAITQSVTSTYETKTDATSKINGVNSSISSLQTRMSNAEQKITDTAITNLVKQNFYTKEETETQITSKGYATSSEVQQTSTALIAKFSASGGYNCIRNSGFLKDFNYWGTQEHNSPTGGSITSLGSTDTWGFPNARVRTAVIRLSNQSSKEYGLKCSVDTTINKIYTIRFRYAAHRVSQANIIVRNGGGGWHTNKYINPSEHSGGNGSEANWGTFTHTFRANSTSHILNFVITEAANDGYFWIAEPMVFEGTLDSPYSPHPSEVYWGQTLIDQNGVRVNASNVNTYTQMSADGFFVKKNDGHLLFEATNKIALYDGKGTSCITIVNDPSASYGNARIDLRGGINFVHNPGVSVGINQILLGNDDRSDKYGYHNMSIRCWNSLGIQDNYGYTNMFADTRRGRWIMKGAVYQNTQTPPATFSMNFDGEDEIYNSGYRRELAVESIMELKTGVYVDNDGECCSAIYGGYSELITTEYKDEYGAVTTHLNHEALNASLVVTCQEQQKLINVLQQELNEIKEYLKIT